MSYSVSIRADTVALATVLRFYTANGILPRSTSDLINRALRDFARLAAGEGIRVPSLPEAVIELENYSGKELEIHKLISLSDLDDADTDILADLQKGETNEKD